MHTLTIYVCTYVYIGEAGHIMLWSFRREQQVRTMKIYASLRSKALRMTNVSGLSHSMMSIKLN